jgi:hypothetical protein
LGRWLEAMLPCSQERRLTNHNLQLFSYLPRFYNLAIDFSIHIDFVKSLSDYFAVMLPALLLMFAATLYRVGYAFFGAPVAWANFSPLAAILLCGAAYFPKKTALLLGAGPIVVADLFLNAHYHAPLIDTGMFSRYFSFALILLLGFWIRKQRYYKMLLLFAAALASSSLFYLITNTGAWMATADYPKTFPGWWQALTIGLPGFPSTLFFFRNTIFSDLFFTALFVVVQTSTSRARITEAAPSTVRIPIHRR